MNTRKIRCLWLLGLVALISVSINGQNTIIKGKVKDSTGEPLTGATVLVTNNATSGVLTDIDGNFSISVPPQNKAITVSFIGMKAKEIDVKGKSFIEVVLEEDNSTTLDDVVVIGYGTTRRRDLTGAISSVNEKTIKDIPVTSALEAISGRMAGVNVTVTDGSPDAEIKVRVRGGGSITQDNSPLFIVDGFFVNNINEIPTNDIESIDVLKDASSTAIYGAKGANGVVLITTKRGKAGKISVTVNSYIGFKNTYKLTNVLSPYEYVYYQKEVDPNPSVSSGGFYGMYGMWADVDLYRAKEGIDWQDQLYGNTGVQRNMNVSILGGTEKLQYNVSYTHDDEDYIMLNSKYGRDNVSVRLNSEINKNLSFDFTGRVTKTVIDGPNVASGRKLRDGIKYAPVKSLATLSMESLGGSEELNWAESASSLNDPISNTLNEYKKQNTLTTLFNAGVTWKILDNLTYRIQGNYSFENGNTDNIWLKKTGESNSNGGQPVAQREDNKGERWTIQNTLTYNLKLADIHNFNIMVGQEAISSQRNDMLMKSKFYPADYTAKEVLAMWNNGTPDPTYHTMGEPSRSASFFGRINYTIKDRYYLTLTAREDGVNVFGPGKKWGFFPGAALAWRLSDESFMDFSSDWMSSSKVRLSYGEAGNARVGSHWRQNYEFEKNGRNLYYIGEKVQSGLRPTNILKNENLTWETKTSMNLGFDLNFFNDRLGVVLDFYKDVTKDLILSVDIPTHSGYSNQYRNLGQTSNRGVEVSLNYHAIEHKDYNLSFGFNIAFNKNKIDKLDGNDSMIASSGWGLNIGNDDYRAVVGKSVGLIWGYQSDGMYTFDDFDFDATTKRWKLKPGVADCSSQVVSTSGNYFGPGHIKLKKLTDDGTNMVTPDDRTIIGDAQPLHTGGFNINAGYKGFDLAVLFNWSYGNDIYNANKIDNTTYAGSKRYQNLSTEMSLANRFSTIDPETGYNIMFGEYANPQRLQEINKNATIWHPLSNSTVLTDWAIEDGSFLRLGTLTLGYTFPQLLSKKISAERLRIYATAYNLYCWTNYSGQDPEVDTRRSTPLTPGVDYSAYPKARTFLFGVNVTF